MSIASNVILENEKLGTALTLLRNKITNVRGSTYYNEENLNILLKRFMAPNKGMDFTNWRSDWFIMKGQTKTGLIAGCDKAGEVIAVFIVDNNTQEETYIGSFISDDNGRFNWTYTGQGLSKDTNDKTISFRGINDIWNMSNYTDGIYVNEQDSESLASQTTLVKYPSSTSATVAANQELAYYDCILFSKTYGSSQFAYLYPSNISSGLYNLRVKAMIASTHSSNSGWREGIYLNAIDPFSGVNVNYPYGYSLINTPGNCKLTSGNKRTENILASRGSQLTVGTWYIYDLMIQDLKVRGRIYDEYENVVWDSGEITIPEQTRFNYYPTLYIGDYGGGMNCASFYVFDLGD
ncbi:hypothetical protein [Methanobrevibacter sp.]